MLNDKTLKASLQSGANIPVYLITGDDAYLKKQAASRIIAATVEPDDEMNLIHFDTHVQLQELYDELNGFPIMADKKCVVLTDYDFEDATKTDFENLCSLACEPYETTVFVILFNAYEVDYKSLRFKELAAAVEKAGGAQVRIEHKTTGELARWLSALAKKNGCELSFQNAQYLIEICSVDINILSNEISKLCSFVKKGEITKDIIDSVSVKSVEASVYDLSKKIIFGDSSGAMNLLDELFFMNVKPITILFNISSVFVDMYRALAAKKAGIRPVTLTENFGYGKRTFVLERAENNLRKFDEKKLELSFDAILKAEKEVKSFSSDERPIIEKLIVRLIYIMKTGEALD